MFMESKKILFIYKSLDELQTLLNLPFDSYVIYSDATEIMEKKFYNALRVRYDLSNENMFNDNNFIELKPIIDNVDYIWTFYPSEILDACTALNKRILCNPYNIYKYLDNKILQVQFLKKESDILKLNIQNKENYFETQYVMGSGYIEDFNFHKNSYVFTSQFSHGGLGVILVSHREQAYQLLVSNPSAIYRVEIYRGESIPYNQTGIVYKNRVVLLNPVKQIIKVHNNNLRFGGTKIIDESELSKDIVYKINELTNEVGRCLHKLGYLGIFGCDYLYINNAIFLTEINPRYQGSTLFLEKSFNSFSPFEEHFKAFTDVCEYSIENKVLFTNSYFPVDKPNMIYERHFDIKEDTDNQITSSGYTFTLNHTTFVP